MHYLKNSNYSQTTSGTGNTVNTDYRPWLVNNYVLWTNMNVNWYAWFVDNNYQLDYSSPSSNYIGYKSLSIRPVITIPES